MRSAAVATTIVGSLAAVGASAYFLGKKVLNEKKAVSATKEDNAGRA